MEKLRISQEYSKLRFYVYKIEVGVVWEEKDNKDYECYNNVYDKKRAYYDENVAFELDYQETIRYAKDYVKNGVNGTYAIVSKILFDNEEYQISMEDTMYMVQTILGGGNIGNYPDLFSSKELYGTENIIYSIMKQKNEQFTYPNKDGDLIENFVEVER